MAKKSISDVLIKFKGDNKELDKSLTDSQKKLKKFTDSAIKRIKQMGAAFAATAVIVTAYSIKQAMTFNQLERGFESLTKSHSTNSDKFLKDLRKMSYGTMSTADIMRSANKAMLLDIDPTAITTMMKGSAAIAQATGQDVNYMFESLSMGIARQSPMLLDNLGIKIKLGEVNEQLANKLGIHKDALTDEQKAMAFQDAAMDGVNKRLIALGGYTIDTKTKWDQLTVSFKDASVALGQQLMPEFDKILTWLLENKEWMVTTFDDIFDIEVTNFGDFTVKQLDKVKNWIDENKADIKWWVNFTKTLTGMEPRPLMGGEGDTVAEQAARHAAAASAEEAYFRKGGVPGAPRQTIQISLDPESVIKFLTGQVVGVTNFATISGT